jgi:CheY-like chemotaxis protein
MEAVTTSPRLLVVDDEATILELLSGSLRLAGFEAASGAAAVRARSQGMAQRTCPLRDRAQVGVMRPSGRGARHNLSGELKYQG